MNSIESYSPPKATSIDEDSSLVPAALGSDAAALEALRALMGGAANQQPAFGVTLVDDKTKLTPELSERLASLMQNLLSDDSVPPSLVPLLNSLGDKLKSGGDLANDAEALAQFQTLMNSLKAEPAQSPLTISNTPSAADALRRALEDAFTSNSTRNAAQAKVDRTDIPAVAELPISDVVTLMPGTEVRVWREDGGQLRVEFDTTNAYWARVLNDSTTQLSQRLSERLNLAEGAQVTVQHESGQPQDGRSRNRHTPWELAQQQDNE
jgi:hypothetical protein